MSDRIDRGDALSGTFGKYSSYYNLLYRDKDYESEADYISALLKLHVPQGEKLLDLGCGTGRHATLLARKGYFVHGVDRSEAMLDVARARLTDLPPDIVQRVSFSLGDVRNVRFNIVFDAVLSLFHVVSYQTGNDDLIAMFRNAAGHLRPGGVFVFDYWYGPAVLTDRPAVRIKRMESEEIAVTRLAEPVIHAAESRVDVNYHIFIRNKASEATEELRETHRMRYLFSTEIDLLAELAGLRVLDSSEWMTGRRPGFHTWGVCSVLVK